MSILAPDSPPQTTSYGQPSTLSASRNPAGQESNGTGESASPWAIWRTLRRHRHLIFQLTRREVLARYRGSYLGVLWSFLNPLAMLAVFSVVFGVIFQGKFTGHPSESPVDFALQLFAGLIIFNVIGECLARGPNLMLANTNYVTKVVFPLQILPVTVVLNALVNLLFSLVPLLVGILVFRGRLPWTLALWPLLLLPLLLLALGVTWLLSALGVFFRDFNELVGPLSQVLVYASAIFYPIERVPAGLQPILRLNPLAFLAEQSRNLTIWGIPPRWEGYGVVLGASLLFATAAYAVFTRVKHTFADVL